MRWKCLQATVDFGNAGSGRVFSKPKILAVFITFLANILRGLVVFASLRMSWACMCVSASNKLLSRNTHELNTLRQHLY